MIVQDASALLALIFQERGAQQVQTVLYQSLINTVTLAEVSYKLEQKAFDVTRNLYYLEANGLHIQPFHRAEALLSAELISYTQTLGLSLGDRACLATAIQAGLPCMTADRAWLQLAHPELEVKCIR